MSDLVIPDVAGEILGWRAWKVSGEGQYLRLRSINARGFGVPEWACVWPPDRWMLALCVHHPTQEGVPHPAPCKCGLYSAATREHLLEYGYSHYQDERDDVVIGVAGLVGRVIPGRQGWRAERSRIVRLEVPYEKEPLARRLAEIYRVPTGLGVLWDRVR